MAPISGWDEPTLEQTPALHVPAALHVTQAAPCAPQIAVVVPDSQMVPLQHPVQVNAVQTRALPPHAVEEMTKPDQSIARSQPEPRSERRERIALLETPQLAEPGYGYLPFAGSRGNTA